MISWITFALNILSPYTLLITWIYKGFIKWQLSVFKEDVNTHPSLSFDRTWPPKLLFTQTTPNSYHHIRKWLRERVAVKQIRKFNLHWEYRWAKLIYKSVHMTFFSLRQQILCMFNAMIFWHFFLFSKFSRVRSKAGTWRWCKTRDLRA